MKSTIGMALFALFVSANGAFADSNTVTYTLGIKDGGGTYCDGVTLTETSDGTTNIASGYHLNWACDGRNSASGGFFNHTVKGVGKNLWSSADAQIGTNSGTVFYLDQKAMTWVLYFQWGNQWYKGNYGPLVEGFSTPKHGERRLVSSVAAAKLTGAAKVTPQGFLDQTETYTFADENGVPYCDGITLSQSITYETGTHTGCTNNDSAAGSRGAIPSVVPGVGRVVYTTDSANVPGLYESFVIDEKNKTWALYVEAPDGSTTWSQLATGRLLKGAPPVGATKRSSSSAIVRSGK